MPELLKAGFKVRILTRSASSHPNLPDGVELREVDYDSKESLKEALRGQDALVSAVTPLAIPNQKVMIDAAIDVGVKHFIPADYSMVTTDPEIQWLPAYATVVEIQKYLQPRSEKLDWTVVAPGATMSLIFDVPYVIDFKNRTAELLDGGDTPVSCSELDTAAKAVAGVLKQPERVKNHSVHVHDTIVTQRETLEYAKKYDPNPDSWKIMEGKAEDKLQEGLDRLSKGDVSMETIAMTLAGCTWMKDKYNMYYSEPDNDWLGIKMKGPKHLEEVIREKVLYGIDDIGGEQILPKK